MYDIIPTNKISGAKCPERTIMTAFNRLYSIYSDCSESSFDKKTNEDCFWCVAKVSKGDILAFGNHDTRRYNNDRAYYAVTDITEDSMKLLSENNEKGFTTIRKALKALKIWEETIEPHEESSPFTQTTSKKLQA